MPLVLARPDERSRSAGSDEIQIALLNNLGDGGLELGEQQFVDLLRRVAGERPVRLRLFSLPTIARGAAGSAHIATHYCDFTELPNARLDGLIITGSEPHAQELSDETFWPQLTEVMDWAEHNTRSTIFSCLAAHAAVLHFDGIKRKALATKCTGLFPVTRTGAHPLLDGAPDTLRVPHSRWNGLEAGKLAAAGYQILTQGPTVGADTFVKSWRSLFIYLQGHPEYDSASLRREYRRDVARYLEGSGASYPTVPVDYFDRETELRLEAFATRARDARDPSLLGAFPLDRDYRTASVDAAHDFAATLFGNWLHYLHARTSDHVV